MPTIQNNCGTQTVPGLANTHLLPNTPDGKVSWSALNRNNTTVNSRASNLTAIRNGASSCHQNFATQTSHINCGQAKWKSYSLLLNDNGTNRMIHFWSLLENNCTDKDCCYPAYPDSLTSDHIPGAEWNFPCVEKKCTRGTATWVYIGDATLPGGAQGTQQAGWLLVRNSCGEGPNGESATPSDTTPSDTTPHYFGAHIVIPCDTSSWEIECGDCGYTSWKWNDSDDDWVLTADNCEDDCVAAPPSADGECHGECKNVCCVSEQANLLPQSTKMSPFWEF